MNYILRFILALYADHGVPRSVVHVVISFINNFLVKIFIPSLKNDINSLLEKENISDFTRREIERYFTWHGSLYEAVDTEWKRLSLLKNKGMIDFEEFKVGTVLVEKIVGNNLLLKPENRFGVSIPLRKSLKLFLQIPGIWTKMMNYIAELANESYLITNIMQARLWRNKYAQRFSNEIILSLYIFMDDLEVGNALGSHTGVNKFLAIYAMIGCLPPSIASQLSCIIFYGLIHSTDKKETTNESAFKKLFDELNFLSSAGITVEVNESKIRVKFQLALVLGDNLGLNSMFGFVESFRSHFYCRICRCSSEEASKLSVESALKVRTINNYDEDVKLADYSKTGIKEKCAFHAVNGFHITENVFVDLMHDVLEGVCMFIMNRLIHTFAFEKTYFTLQYLNTKMRSFDYGPENSNKPTAITINRITHHCDLKMSAAEVLCFVQYFGLIIGDKIPEDDDHYKLYSCLRKNVDILFSPRITPVNICDLEKLIKELNETYLRFYGNLKPKMHFLTHYPRILRDNGPVVNFWGMRFESNHRPTKEIAECCSNSKNLLKTIAKKQSLIMCNMMYSLQFHESIKLGSLNNKVKQSHFQYFQRNSSVKYYIKITIDSILQRLINKY